MDLSDAARSLLQKFADDPDLSGFVDAAPLLPLAPPYVELFEAGLLQWEIRLSPKGEKKVRKMRQKAAHEQGERVRAEELAAAKAKVAELEKE